MKIALLQPPVEDFYHTSIRTQPVGLLYLAAVLEAAGHRVRIFDFLSSREKQAIPFPRDFGHLKPDFHLGDSSPIRIFKHYYHYGTTWQSIERAIARETFDLYGITCMFTPFQGQAQRLAKLIRKYHPDRFIVAGGTHATSCPERLLGSGVFDCVFQGEGEISLLRWIETMRVRTPGTRQAIEPAQRVECLDELPFPARHLIDLDRYRIGGVRSTMLITSRGCPYHCTFCSVQQTMGHAFRVRSVENVLREIEHCVERFDIRHFDIEDDNFTFDQRRAEQILAAVLDRFGQGALRFSAMNGLTATQLEEPLLRRMRQAGFQEINLSLVAAQPQTLRQLKRPVSLSGFRRTVEKARGAGLRCVAYFILGLPGDDRRRMLETLLALAAEPVLVGPSVFYVSPGTELFEALRDRVPDNWDLLRSSTFFMESGTSTRLERITVFRLARLINFLKRCLDSNLDVAQASSLWTPETILGWAVVHLLARTGRFHAACRNKKGSPSYRFEPLPTCERTVRQFFEMAAQTQLCGVQTSRKIGLREMICQVDNCQLDSVFAPTKEVSCAPIL